MRQVLEIQEDCSPDLVTRHALRQISRVQIYTCVPRSLNESKWFMVCIDYIMLSNQVYNLTLTPGSFRGPCIVYVLPEPV